MWWQVPGWLAVGSAEVCWVPGAQCTVMKGHTDAVRSIAFLSDNIIASGSADNTVQVWDTMTGLLTLHGSLVSSHLSGRRSAQGPLACHNSAVTSLRVGSEECLLISGSSTEAFVTQAAAVTVCMLSCCSLSLTVLGAAQCNRYCVGFQGCTC